MAAPNYRPVRVPVAVAGRVLGFSKQAYYKWVKNPVSALEAEDRELTQKLFELHVEDPEFGYRLLADEMHALGYLVSERRVWRLCNQAGIRSVISKRKRKTVRAGEPTSDDLVKRQFVSGAPNRLWLTDIKEHDTNDGRLYLCALKDVFSNRIVGYSIGDTMRASLAVQALQNALMQRDYPGGVVVHSDRGSQFRSGKYRHVLAANGLLQSMGQVGSAGDNAAMESFFSLLQKNVLDRKSWASRSELRLAIVAWIEGKYHRKRRQRRLGKLTPVEFEMVMMETVAIAA